MSALILVGGGGHCRSCIDVVEAEATYSICGIIDRGPPEDADVLGYPVLGDDSSLLGLVEIHKNALVTVGQIRSPDARTRLYALLRSLGAVLPTIVSPHGYVSRHAHLGEGTVVFHGAIINAGASVGQNCIVNSRALLEHDAQLGDHCHLSTGAIVNGACRIGAGTFVGSGAVIHQDVTIGAGCVISAGTIVKSDLPDGTIIRAHG